MPRRKIEFCYQYTEEELLVLNHFLQWRDRKEGLEIVNEGVFTVMLNGNGYENIKQITHMEGNYYLGELSDGEWMLKRDRKGFFHKMFSLLSWRRFDFNAKSDQQDISAIGIMYTPPSRYNVKGGR